MKKEIKIYLSGSMSNNPLNPSKQYWTSGDEKILSDLFKQRAIETIILNPNDANYQRTVDLFNNELNFISAADLFLVDLSERRGIGVGVELYHAHIKNIPVIAVCPDLSYYKNSSEKYLHPFILEIVPNIFDSKDELFSHLKSFQI